MNWIKENWFKFDKQEGFVQIPILIAIVIGLVITGTASYIGVSKYTESKQVNTETLEERIEELEKQLENTATTSIEQGQEKQTENQTPTSIQNFFQTVSNPIPTTNQTQSTTGIDLCPNITGIQEVVPEGLRLYRETNTCITQREMDKLSEAEAEKRAKKEQCDEAKQDAVDIALEKEAALTEHNAILAEIQENSGGGLQSAVESNIQAENNRYSALIDSLNAQLVTANYLILQYCE